MQIACVWVSQFNQLQKSTAKKCSTHTHRKLYIMQCVCVCVNAINRLQMADKTQSGNWLAAA